MQANIAALTEAGVKVVGVSMDKAPAQKKFKEGNELSFPLIADPDGVVVKAFGVQQRAIGICARQSFLVKDGKIAWVDEKPNTKTHGEDVLAAAKALKEE